MPQGQPTRARDVAPRAQAAFAAWCHYTRFPGVSAPLRPLPPLRALSRRGAPFRPFAQRRSEDVRGRRLSAGTLRSEGSGALRLAAAEGLFGGGAFCGTVSFRLDVRRSGPVRGVAATAADRRAVSALGRRFRAHHNPPYSPYPLFPPFRARGTGGRLFGLPFTEFRAHVAGGPVTRGASV